MEEPLHVGSNPAALTSGAHKWIVIKEGQQDWIYSLDQNNPEPPHIKEEQEDPEPPHIKEEQEDPESPHIQEDPDIKADQEDPEPPHIKEDQEELWTSQEGEQLQGLEEAGIKFSFTSVMSEDDEEEAQSSQLHQRQTEQMETEAGGEDCGGPEPDSNSVPDRHPEPDTDEESGDSSEPDTDDCGDLKETREPQSGLNSLNNEEVSVSDSRNSAGEKPFSCSECEEGEQLLGLEEAGIKFSFTPVKSQDDEEEAQSSQLHQRQTEQMETEADGEDCGGPEPDRKSEPDTDEETGDSSDPDTDDCDDLKETREPQSGLNSLNNEEVYVSGSKCSTGERLLSCSECGERFQLKRDLNKHMRIHTREKTFKCLVCDKSFKRKSHLMLHVMTHTGEKPFSCSVCKKSFKRKSRLMLHMMTHTVKTPFSCLVCKKSFQQSGHLKTHMMTHTVKKPFRCSECDKSFKCKSDRKKHMMTHKRENSLWLGHF